MSIPLISGAIPMPQLTAGHAAVGVGYSLVGAFPQAVVYMAIISTLNAAVQVSFDGVNDHIAIPAGSTTPVYFTIPFKASDMNFPNCAIFVKQIGAPATGSLYVTGFSAVIP